MMPPFPFFTPGMPLPPGMQLPSNMSMPPFGGDMTMPWFNDPVFAGGMSALSNGGKLPHDYHDENKDIFGKPVNNAPPKSAPLKHYAPPTARTITKPDLFEPQYAL